MDDVGELRLVDRVGVEQREVTRDAEGRGPTTSRPVIAPPRNATCSASFRPTRASAVRTLARTEMFMPMMPQAPESTAPMKKPHAEGQSMKNPIRTKRTAPTMAMVLY